MSRLPLPRPGGALRALVLSLMTAALVLPGAARAQEELENVFGDLGTTSVDDSERKPGEGAVTGQVVDQATGAPISGATVILMWPEPAAGGERKQALTVSDVDGAFEFASVPPGPYDISFVKAGYKPSKMQNFQVVADVVNRADFPMPPVPTDPTGASGDVIDLDEFIVEAEQASELMEALDLRLESDQQLNIMSAEDLSKFAAGDIGDALKRVAGVNVVAGEFAVIRGLEERYSSTTYNDAVVPSPDPDRQSVQLDLFQSDIVDNLVISKTFGPELPSNSSGGAINVVTHGYSESPLDWKISVGSGYNSNAFREFLEFNEGSPVGHKTDDMIERDLSTIASGRSEFFGREVRYKAIIAQEVDFETKDGWQEGREAWHGFRGTSATGLKTGRASAADGELPLSAGQFDLTESERSEQRTRYFGGGIDLDTEGAHRLDMSYFFTSKKQETVQARDDGFLPEADYTAFAQEYRQSGGEAPRIHDNSLYNGVRSVAANSSLPIEYREASIRAQDGPFWFSPWSVSRSFDRERELRVLQLNGVHEIGLVEGLEVRWLFNSSETQQDEESMGLAYYFEPDDKDIVPDGFLRYLPKVKPGEYRSIFNSLAMNVIEVDEEQTFSRLDADWTTELGRHATFKLSVGGFLERAEREVDAGAVENSNVPPGNAIFGSLPGNDPELLGSRLLTERGYALDNAGLPVFWRRSANDSTRDVSAYYFGSKLTLFERLDLLGGFRVERLVIESNNDPFTGELVFGTGAPAIFPSAYLLFDRNDNPGRTFQGASGENGPPPGTPAIFNDQILNIRVPVDPATGYVDLETRGQIQALVDGEIDEDRTLPSLGLAFRPIEGMTLRGSFSRTMARPSFRELGYYLSTEPGSTTRSVGNPQLQVSDVTSYDVRLEYVWGDRGDLFAVSAFTKDIEAPIEKVVIRDPKLVEDSIAFYETWFNNGNDADLEGIEVELRKNLDFLGLDWLEYFTVGGNYTYIDAEVERSAFEIERAQIFFDAPKPLYRGLERTRRLFGQPEWIVNADVTFDHPDWGTRLTLAYFSISDVLDAAGSANPGANGLTRSLVFDRYLGSFHQLDLVMSQELWISGLTFKLSVKNLTDSKRTILYDPEQTRHTILEREFRVGNDVSLSLSYSREF